MAKTKRRSSQSETKKKNFWPIVIAGAAVILIVGGLILLSQNATKPVVAEVVVDYPTGITADGAPYKGGADAKVIIEDFSDFRCSHCATLASNLNELKTDYIDTGKVQIVYKNFAFLGQGSISAAQAAACAQEQSADAFWAYHDALFANQGRGEAIYTRSGLTDIAEQIGLDTDAFGDCLKSGAVAARIQQEKLEGDNRGVESTPTMFINGEMVVGAIEPSILIDVIENELSK